MAKIKANRHNGAKSQGPKTVAGKRKASRNRFLYAIKAEDFIAPGENLATFRKMPKQVLTEWQPETPLMRREVHRLCYQLWQRERLHLYERFVLGKSNLASELPIDLRWTPDTHEVVSVLVTITELQIKLDSAIAQTVYVLERMQHRMQQLSVMDVSDKNETSAAVSSVDREPMHSSPPPADLELETPRQVTRQVISTMQAPRMNFGQRQPGGRLFRP